MCITNFILERIIASLGFALIFAINPISPAQAGNVSPVEPFSQQLMYKSAQRGEMFKNGMTANKYSAFEPPKAFKADPQRNHISWSNQGCESMMGDIMMYKMSPKQQQEFLDQTVELRKQMVTKHFDYIETTRRPDTTFQDLADIEKEMLSIRLKILEKIISNSAQ